jgi:hypothetical protein
MDTIEYTALRVPRNRTSVGKIMILGFNNLIRHILCSLLLRLAHRQIKGGRLLCRVSAHQR